MVIKDYGISRYQSDSSGGARTTSSSTTRLSRRPTNATAAIRTRCKYRQYDLEQYPVFRSTGGSDVTYRIGNDGISGLVSDYNVTAAFPVGGHWSNRDPGAVADQTAGRSLVPGVAIELFANAASNDYHLSSSSPAIDAGTSTGLSVDLDGNIRPVGLIYDIGAYEFQSSASPKVTQKTPLPDETWVPSTTNVTATFNKSIKIATLSFVLTDSNNVPVPATVNYNDTTYKATLSPSVTLSYGATYTVTVSGAKDQNDVPMDGPLVWHFSTISAPGSIFTLWSSTTTPLVLSVNDNNPVEVGVKFTSDQAGSILGVRFYKGPSNLGTHVGHLWTSTGALLATKTFSNETASGWQEVSFDIPVAINANTTYVASCLRRRAITQQILTTLVQAATITLPFMGLRGCTHTDRAAHSLRTPINLPTTGLISFFNKIPDS